MKKGFSGKEIREIVFRFVVAIALPILALLSIFWYRGASNTPVPTLNSFPYVVPKNIISKSEPKPATILGKQEQSTGQTKQPATANVSSATATIGGAAAGVVQKTTESWNDFIARFYPTPASLPATSVLGSLYVGGIVSPDPFPLRNWQVPLKDIDGWAVISTELPENKVLYEKDIFTPHPIASISKLMTGLVVADALDLNEEVIIDKKAVSMDGDEAGLTVGETLTVRQLLYAMLLESSNDAAIALAEDFDLHRTQKANTFVVAMNKKAHDLNLTSMSFEDPTGLSPNNVSDAQDVAQLMFTAYQNDTLRPILGTAEYDAQSKEGAKHHWVSTDSLLGQIPGVMAGKTGFINEAGQCLVVVSSMGSGVTQKIVVSVVLGSSNRMQAMATLLSWIRDAYTWQ